MNLPRFPFRTFSRKVRPSATPATLRAGRRAPAPGLPIRPGAFSFQPWRIALVLAIFAGIWLLSYSGLTRLDL